MACRGICERVRLDKRRYARVVKRCTYCDVYLVYQDSFCLCCGRKLRSKRKSKYRDGHHFNHNNFGLEAITVLGRRI